MNGLFGLVLNRLPGGLFLSCPHLFVLPLLLTLRSSMQHCGNRRKLVPNELLTKSGVLPWLAEANKLSLKGSWVVKPPSNKGELMMFTLGSLDFRRSMPNGSNNLGDCKTFADGLKTEPSPRWVIACMGSVCGMPSWGLRFWDFLFLLVAHPPVCQSFGSSSCAPVLSRPFCCSSDFRRCLG